MLFRLAVVAALVLIPAWQASAQESKVSAAEAAPTGTLAGNFVAAGGERIKEAAKAVLTFVNCGLLRNGRLRQMRKRAAKSFIR